MSRSDGVASERHDRLRTLFNTSPDAIILHESTGAILDVNEQAVENLGYSREQLRSMDVPGIEIGIDSEGLRQLWEGITAGDRETVEGQHRRADGSTFPVEVSIRKLDVDGEERFLTLCRDITERKQHEHQLSALHGANRRLIDADSRLAVAEIAVETAHDMLDFSLPSMWYPTDGALELVASSEGHQQLLAEAGTTDPVHPPDSWLWDAFEAGETVVRSPLPPEDLAADVPLHSAIVLPIGDHGVLACAAEGEIAFTDHQVQLAETLARNVQAALDQLDQQVALERQQQFTDDLLDAIEDVVYVLDEAGDLVEWNRAFEGVTGYSGEAIGSMNAVDFFVEADRGMAAAAVEEAFETGRTRVELDFLTADGTQIPYEFVANRFTDPDGESVIAGIGRDRTPHVEYERELGRYEELVENVPVGIYRNTPGASGTFIEVNPAMVRMFDADSEAELLTRSVSELYADPDDRDEISRRLVDEGILSEREIELETLSGDHFWGSVTAVARQIDGETYFDGVIQDITERIEYERTLEDQRDNLELLNQVVRHDIRNDLQLVLAYAETLEAHVEGDGEEYVRHVLEAARDAVDITITARDVTALLLHQETERVPLGLRPVLENEIDEVRSANERALVTVEGTIPQVDVLADDMLESVFRNLLTNAIGHNDKEVPEVTVSASTTDDLVRIRIADNGPGIPDNQKERIFEEGEKGLDSDGTGLGLYLVETLVVRYEGDVWVTDNEPEGSVFVVELPLIDG